MKQGVLLTRDYTRALSLTEKTTKNSRQNYIKRPPAALARGHFSEVVYVFPLNATAAVNYVRFVYQAAARLSAPKQPYQLALTLHISDS